MPILPLESKDEKNISLSIAQFLTAYGIINLLRKCGGAKLKGVPVKELFTYTLTNAFRMASFYMQQKMGRVRENFPKTHTTAFLRAIAQIGCALPRSFPNASSISIFARLHPSTAMTALSLTIPCMRRLVSSVLNMYPGFLTMCRSGT